jgi:hypothetical protein
MLKLTDSSRLPPSQLSEVLVIGSGITIIADINLNCTNSANWTVAYEVEWLSVRVKWRRFRIAVCVDDRNIGTICKGVL